MTTVPKFEGKIRFHIKGAEALPAWTRKAIKAGLDSPSGPPEELRFQCRIAMDAREVFERIDLADGSALRMSHTKTRPQFGKNRDGLAYLTTTLTHDATGEAYRVKWVGDAVPLAMKRTAVAHDEGRKIGPKTVLLDLALAEIVPAHKAVSVPHKSERDVKAEVARRKELRAAGIEPVKRAPRHCARVTASDI